MMKVTLVALLLMSTYVYRTAAQGGIWTQLALALVKNLATLWQSGDFQFLGHECHYRINPTVKRLKWKYKGKFWCPSWTSITGRATKSSRSGAVEHSVRDFVSQAKSSGLITEKEAQTFISQYDG
ncbi:anti-lipopolysaccharide factor [Tachypleus tridentatus]|uniref:anti-lipopolysaccharide factor n=1 Tax=Tachypleus tridentatus TaxID=6853 RepID=UPI003FD1D9BA